MVYVDITTVEDERHTLGPFEGVMLSIGRGEMYADGVLIVAYGDMFGYSDRVTYSDGSCQAITHVAVR